MLQAEQVEAKGKLPGGMPSWNPSRIKGFVGISGVYNCWGLADHLHKRGLYRSLFDRIMSIKGETQLKLLSPTYCVKVRVHLFLLLSRHSCVDRENQEDLSRDL